MNPRPLKNGGFLYDGTFVALGGLERSLVK
jgi:hypothetical protein